MEYVAVLRAEADAIEREALTSALDATSGSEAGAAAVMGTTRDVVHAMLRRGRHPGLAERARAQREEASGAATGSPVCASMRRSPSKP